MPNKLQGGRIMKYARRISEDHFIQRIICATAKSMKESYLQIGALNGAYNSPIPERNVVIHLASELIKRLFAVFAEASFYRNRKRLDLVAHKGNIVLVFEVKTFGNIDYKAIKKDIKRVETYKPMAWPFCDKTKKERDAFWKMSQKWGVVIIQWFGGSPDSDEITQTDRDPKRVEWVNNKGFNNVPICKDNVWKDTGAINLVWKVIKRRK
jgi:hypothetical protein